MFLAELRIENFRMFGQGEQALVAHLRPGQPALVGESNTGKTALIDALRLALGTRDREFLRVEESDSHQPSDGQARRTEIRIRCKYEDLGRQDIAAFVEYLKSRTTGRAGGMKDVNRSKRLVNLPPPEGGATEQRSQVDRGAGPPLAASGCTPEWRPRFGPRWTRSSLAPTSAAP